MAIINNRSIAQGASGGVGKSLMLRTYGDRTVLSKKPSRRRKRTEKQMENSLKFKAANQAAKWAIRNPEIKAYFKRVAESTGKRDACTAAVSAFHKNPLLTTAQILIEARKPFEEKVQKQNTLQIKVTSANGDIIAQGVAICTKDGRWCYTAPVTGLSVSAWLSLNP